MIKDINFGGYSAQPSDYQCPDGELDIFLNLINEDGDIRPIRQPSRLRGYTSSKGNFIPLFIHKINDGKRTNIILRGASDNLLYWSDYYDVHILPLDGDILAESATIKAIGNTIAILTPDGLEYFLWQERDKKNYRHLGKNMPFPLIKFYLHKFPRTSGLDYDFSAHGEGPFTGSDDTADSIREWSKNLVWGAVNKYVAEEVHKYNYFAHPFFVRYALRLYDGSNALISPPVLLGINEGLHHVKMYYNRSGSSVSIYGAMTSADLRCTLLDAKTQPDLQQQFTLWRDIIKGIDVFVSAPIYSYDQGEEKGFWFDPSAGSTRDFTLPVKKIAPQIESLANFYHIATIDYDGHSDFRVSAFTPEDGAIPNLVARRTLKSEVAFDHQTIIAKTAIEYNSRLIIGNISRKLFRGFHPAIMCPEGTVDNIHIDNIEWWVRIESLGYSYSVHTPQCFCPSATQIVKEITSPAQTVAVPVDGLFIFYPHAGAKEIIIRVRYNSIKHLTVQIPLHPHDFLDGAYFSNSGSGGTTSIKILESSDWSDTTAEKNSFTPPAYPDSYDSPNIACNSEVNNPFIFELQSVTTVGNGSVKAFATATKALSQGQFGQFPVYAFCSDGIWALELSASGEFSARQPVSRDLILPNSQPLQIDNAVVFPSQRGLMLLSGSETICISDKINTSLPFKVINLPGMTQLHTLLNVENDASLDIKAFSEFLSGCMMVYDYVNQRIIFFNPSEEFAYAYVYSLRSKLWSLVESSFSHTLNSYPDALGVNRDGHIIDFSNGNDILPGLFITRPLKLDAPDILKTVRSVIARGLFKKGHVQSVLYGSRDLYNWHLVWSSKDHYLRGFSGTPYKYFRLALLGKLDAGESISGATVQYQTRKTNQPR